MAHNAAPHAHRVKVREISTGTVVERWPVDARAIVSQSNGTWEYVTGETTATPATADTPSASPATPPAVAPDHRSIADRLDEKSYAELKALAKQAGIIGNIAKPDLIAALIPHIEGRTVSLDEVKGLPPVLPVNQFPTQAGA